jgi:D-sedoheptulose 7-phosphate isomerase
MNAVYLERLAAHRALFEQLDALASPVVAAAQRIAHALTGGNKLLLCGNGGSAADCQHIAAELTGRFVGERRALAAIALTTDTSALTAIGNDYGFDAVFARQVEALARPGDVLLAVSTSGNSPNVLRACEAARSARIGTIALTGGDGGALARAADSVLLVPGTSTALIQEAHTFIGHALCALIEQTLIPPAR